MCLAVPGEVVSIDDVDPLMRAARVSFGGIVKEVSLALLPDARTGDYVLVHAGVGIGVIDAEEAERVFTYLEELGAVEEVKGASP
ncbi:MAG: HypC/HybG/HupF family hydrogenase formation chaperone [Candidatus Hydrogenedentes bacterium]|nr:HypC/HybG/HupF family hydrogenase formation chaperone [Candidatus Hydrogenedentota bacterium]